MEKANHQKTRSFEIKEKVKIKDIDDIKEINTKRIQIVLLRTSILTD